MHHQLRTASRTSIDFTATTLVAFGLGSLTAVAALAPPHLLSGALDLARLILEL